MSVKDSSVGGTTGESDTVELKGTLESQKKLIWREPWRFRYS